MIILNLWWYFNLNDVRYASNQLIQNIYHMHNKIKNKVKLTDILEIESKNELNPKIHLRNGVN